MMTLTVIVSVVSGLLAVAPIYALYRLVALAVAEAPDAASMWRWGVS
jgi:hypothetical protein